MIIDSIRNASAYYELNPNIELALKYLQAQDFSKMEPGKYPISDDCFVMISDYETLPREEKRWEAHRKYIDVQFIADGAEMMGYAEMDSLKVIEEYNESADIIWLEGEGDFLRAEQGKFIIFYPHDAHMPGVVFKDIKKVRKVVVKVPVVE